MSTRARLAPITALLAALALLLAGCGGGGSGSSEGAGDAGSESTPESAGEGSEGAGDTGGADGEESTTNTGLPTKTGLIGVTETDAEPQQGGTLSVGVWVEARTLDPAQAASAGVIGGMETAAIFDVLVRYNPATGEYEPWLATSLEHSEDYATWTLHLRDGVMFSDGTPLDADAVVFNVERAGGKRYDAFVSQIASMETPDDLTVVFHLSKPWSLFPVVLATGPGRVASPTAVKKWGEDFEAHPVGAGPFVVDHISPGEETVLVANENYWGEGPYLDTIRFVPLGGDQARLDTLEADGIEAAFLRDSEVIVSARRAGYGGYVNIASAADVFWINNAEGRPGADPRVRKAIASAINIDQINQRVYAGQGLMQKDLLAHGSRWATEAEATPYDPEKAKELLAQAKADGYDGKLTLSTDSSQTRQREALALQAQFNAVGFETTIETLPSSSALFGAAAKGNFDVGFGGLSIRDAAPWVDLKQLASEAPDNYFRYANPEMDALLNQLHDAPTPEARQQALEGIQRVWTETVPFVPLAAIPEFVAFGDNLHGAVPTFKTNVLFSRAWLS